MGNRRDWFPGVRGPRAASCAHNKDHILRDSYGFFRGLDIVLDHDLVFLQWPNRRIAEGVRFPAPGESLGIFLKEKKDEKKSGNSSRLYFYFYFYFFIQFPARRG
jgi:hypothetical protein